MEIRISDGELSTNYDFTIRIIKTEKADVDQVVDEDK